MALCQMPQHRADGDNFMAGVSGWLPRNHEIYAELRRQWADEDRILRAIIDPMMREGE